MRVGLEYDQPQANDKFQGRVSYHLSTFENGQADLLSRQQPVGTNIYTSLPPSNMANYVTAEGALDLMKSYRTRITGSLSYGWLSQNDYVFESTNSAGPPPSVFGRFNGLAGLGATTFTAHIAGVTRPIAPLALRYSYNAYHYGDNNTSNQVLRTAFENIDNPNLLAAEHYSYFRQGVNLGADYRVNSKVAFNVGYSWKGFTRTEGQGNTSTHSPQVGVKLSPTNWLSLLANYTLTTRSGYNNLAFLREAGEVAVPLTYKSYAGSLIRNNFNFIAEVYPVNNVTCSVNFSIFNDNFKDSAFGIESDQGWSAGADVSWRPCDRVALSLGYDHQQLQTRTLAVGLATPNGESGQIVGDLDKILITSDSYNTFIARADIKLIPKKLSLTTRGSYSFSTSNFNNNLMTNLNEYYADINTFLTYQFNEHWACRAGYIFQVFHMTQQYGTLYLTGIPFSGVQPTTATTGIANQKYNTLDGFYRNATAHLVQGFVQYKF
jgi:opacity protein-like surface antigen